MKQQQPLPKPVPILDIDAGGVIRGFWNIKNSKKKAHEVKTIDYKSLPMYQPHYHRGERT